MAEAPLSPHARAKLKDILQWMRTTRHPHGKCVRALIKRGIPEPNAAKICARTKDAALGTTKWRNRGKK